MSIVTQTQSGVGQSSAILIDQQHFFYGVGLYATVVSGSPGYNIEVSGDGTLWIALPLMTGLSASAVGNLAYPATEVRINMTSGTGVVSLTVVQSDTRWH